MRYLLSRDALRHQCYIKDGKVIKIEGIDGHPSNDGRLCTKGLSNRQYLYREDRVLTPLKRVGKRGEGKFERISWDEAIDLAATKLKEVIEKYGNEAVYLPYATGVSATTARPFQRMMNTVGGFLKFYNSYSTAQISCITPYMYGSKQSGGSSFRGRGC